MCMSDQMQYLMPAHLRALPMLVWELTLERELLLRALPWLHLEHTLLRVLLYLQDKSGLDYLPDTCVI